MSGSRKYTNFTSEEISDYLDDFHQCIDKGNYRISLNKNRKKNKDFIYKYKIDTGKEVEIFNSLTYKDFCYAVDNNNPRYSDEILYVFKKRYKLDSWGSYKEIDIYIYKLIWLRKIMKISVL